MKSTIQRSKSIEVKLEDDRNNEFPIEITYDYSDYYGWDKWEVSVWGFDYKINGSYKPDISDKVLTDLVRDSIREEERCTVTFY